MDLEPEGIVPPDTDEVAGASPEIREIEELVADGRLDEALARVDAAMADDGADDADLHFLRGDICLGLGMAREAEPHFRAVLDGDPDCPSSRCWLAMSLFLQWRFDESEQVAREARSLPDALVDADVVLGCVLERRGELDEAEGLFERAASLAPDKYVLPARMSPDEFGKQVKQAARRLPKQFRQCFDRVPVVVHDLPHAESFDPEDPDLGPDMLGLFDGIPLPETGEYDGPPRPNTIYLFQRNLERMSMDRSELIEQIRITLYHELGHYLGFEEEDMDDLGLA